MQEKIKAGDTSIPNGLVPVPIPVSDSVCSLRTDKAGTHLYGWTSGNEIFLWPIGDRSVSVFKSSGPVLTVEMSLDARYVAVIYKNSSCEVFTDKGTKLFTFRTTANHLMNERLVRFFPSGKYFLAAVNGNMAQIYDSAGTCLFNLEGHTGNVNSLDISPDGRFVVTASSDKRAIIWNFNHKTRVFSPYGTITSHRDTIWSCEFNKNGKYILTASADSSLKISYLGGSEMYSFFQYATNNPKGISSNNGGKHVNDTSVISLNLFKKSVCYAGFMANERAVIATNYSYYSFDKKNNGGVFRVQVIYFGRSSDNNYYSIDRFFIKAKHLSLPLSAPFFSSWVVTPDRLLFAGTPEHCKEIVLIAKNGYQLLKIQGYFPYFSGDGNISIIWMKIKSGYYLLIRMRFIK